MVEKGTEAEVSNHLICDTQVKSFAIEIQNGAIELTDFMTNGYNSNDVHEICRWSEGMSFLTFVQ